MNTPDHDGAVGGAGERPSAGTPATDILAPIRRTRSVPLEPHAAFELFTIGMGSWWPLGTHALSANPVDVRWDARVGGSVVEIDAHGREYPWAEITLWDPPRRLVIAWHLDRDRAESTTVDVRFEPSAAGCTLHLEHRDWPRLGDDAHEARSGYSEGWEPVLDRFVEAGQ